LVNGEVGGNAAQQDLTRFVERIEALKQQRAEINEDIRDVKVEAKAKGYDPRTIEAVIKVRAMGKTVYREQRDLLDTYLAAFGIDDDE
jgi:uncharacterized protein (UPF0335 family)